MVAGRPSCPGVCQGSGVQRGQCQQDSARPAPGAPWLCFPLCWADRLIRNPSILVSALFSWASWLSLCHFSVSCRSVRVLTVFLYWQYWCECSECLCCWTNEDHFPLIFYSGLRGKLLSLNKTSKLKKV